MNAFDPLVQTGALGLCGLMLGVLFWIVKKLLLLITNDLEHVKSAIEVLPCREPKTCARPKDLESSKREGDT